MRQRGFDLGVDAVARAPQPEADSRPRFAKEVETLVFGDRPLREYLESVGEKLPLQIKRLLSEMDLSALMDAKTGGRPALHPRIYLGLCVYGCLTARSSLRDLESLARIDLGGIYLSGGLQPDHSTIGKFLAQHADVLSEAFFIDVTRQLAQKMALGPGTSAIDGTVMQAAASAYRIVKVEAAQRYATELQSEAAASPDDQRLAQRAELAQEAATVGALRESAREELSKSPDTVRVSPTEPDAVVQPLKQAGFAPSYKPAVISHESGLITGQAVDNMSETKTVGCLLDQQQAIVGSNPTALTADAGYNNEVTLKECLERDINLLCPSGREDNDMKRTSMTGGFVKQDFSFDLLRNEYRCPAGQVLSVDERGVDPFGRAYTRYRSQKETCATCTLHSRCTKAATRTIKRYDFLDDAKDALASTLRHPIARAEYARRKVIVEPRFAALRYRQGLVRFRRRGLKGVSLEWAIHCLAHNFGVAARRVRALLFFFLPRPPLALAPAIP
jgi:transposase